MVSPVIPKQEAGVEQSFQRPQNSGAKINCLEKLINKQRVLPYTSLPPSPLHLLLLLNCLYKTSVYCRTRTHDSQHKQTKKPDKTDDCSNNCAHTHVYVWSTHRFSLSLKSFPLDHSAPPLPSPKFSRANSARQGTKHRQKGLGLKRRDTEQRGLPSKFVDSHTA